MCPGRLLGDAGQLAAAAVDELLPPEAQAHLLAAQRELLLAMTVTLEHHLRRVQRERGGAGSGPTRPTRVEVD